MWTGSYIHLSIFQPSLWARSSFLILNCCRRHFTAAAPLGLTAVVFWLGRTEGHWCDPLLRQREGGQCVGCPSVWMCPYAHECKEGKCRNISGSRTSGGRYQRTHLGLLNRLWVNRDQRGWKTYPFPVFGGWGEWIILQHPLASQLVTSLPIFCQTQFAFNLDGTNQHALLGSDAAMVTFCGVKNTMDIEKNPSGV